MRVIAKSHLLNMAKSYGDYVEQVVAWYGVASKAAWHSLSDVLQTYRNADAVGDKTVFNIKGNDYRLVVSIDYRYGCIYIKQLLTQAEYDKGEWKR